MMDNLNFNVKELKFEELSSISGGDRITQAFFSWLGGLIGSIEAAGNAEAQHGVRVRE